MNCFLAFTEKELAEQLRTFKGVVVAAVLLVFGMSSPVLAKMTPELLKAAGVGTLGLPAPTFGDAYAQFFKNIGQIGVIVLILVFAGGIVGEIAKGTSSIVLTKRLSRSGFVLAKFCAGSVVWTLSFALSAGVCILYTVILFPEGKPRLLFLAFFCMWLFGELMIAAALCAGAFVKNYPLAAVAAFCFWAVFGILSALPKIGKYTPCVLAGPNAELIAGQAKAAEMIWPIVTGALLTALLLAAACFALRKREI